MTLLQRLGTPPFLIPAGIACLVAGFTGVDSSPRWLLAAGILLGLGQSHGCSAASRVAIVGTVLASGFVFLIGFVSLFAAAWVAAMPFSFALVMTGVWIAACLIVMRTAIRRLRRTADRSTEPAAKDLEHRQ
jgi:hypothetical protein